MKKSLIFVYGMLLNISSWMLSGFTIEMYIKWFLNPIFGIKIITLTEGICLVLVFSFITKNIAKNENKFEENKNILFEERYAFMTLTLIYLILGAIFHKILM